MKEKFIKTTNMNMDIRCSKHLIVDINELRFIFDEEIPHWVTILNCINGEDFESIDEIDNDSVLKIHTIEDLKKVALNWYFDNVEVVEKI